MARLLHIEASPRKERSSSLRIAREFLGAYAEANPDDEIETLDLWTTDLPQFDGFTIDGKYRIMHGQEHTPEEAMAWKHVVEVFQRFANAEKYLFSLPMWNFGIPYRLKHFIDVITQPGLAFAASQEGTRGLVTGRPAAVICSRGGDYSSAPAADFQMPYLEFLLRFIGFTEIRTITIEPTLGAPDAVETVRTSAGDRARELARTF